MKHVLIVLTMFVGFSLLMIVLSSPALAQTATPTMTITPYGTPYWTPTPTPTATPQPDFVLNDYQMMEPESTYWHTSSSAVEWSPHRYKIPIGQSITQSVQYMTSTGPYTITVRALATTTSTLELLVNDSVIHTWTVTGTRLSTYQTGSTVSLPATIKVRTASGGPVSVDQVAMDRSDEIHSQSYEHSPQPATSAGIAEMVDWFQAIQLHEMFTTEFNWDWDSMMHTVAQVATTLLVIATPHMIEYWFAGRIVIMCALWFFGWVMQKIGRPIPASTSTAVIYDRAPAWRSQGLGLPRLPPSGIRRGRSRW